MLWLAHALSFDRIEDKRAELAVAIIEAASGPYGLVVDNFLGEVEIVVKPLNGVLARVPEYVGAAIMGDGKTVLVVNTERLFSLQRPATMPQTERPVASPPPVALARAATAGR
jgi:chemotaxis protein histidine kinase CheA